MRTSLEFCYVIFVTPWGKGYGCFALDKSSIVNGEVKVGASFCSPFNYKVFSKSVARDLATKKLETSGIIVLDELIAGDMKYQDIENCSLVSLAVMDEVVFMPKWVYKAFERGSYFFTLKNSKMSFNDMVDELDVGQELFVDLKTSVDNSGHWANKYSVEM